MNYLITHLINSNTRKGIVTDYTRTYKAETAEEASDIFELLKSAMGSADTITVTNEYGAVVHSA